MDDSVIFSVAGLARSADHGFSKAACSQLTVQAGIGVEGDAHAGPMVQHRSRVARDPSQPNLRQVHLIDTGFVATLAQQGFDIAIGDIGENIRLSGTGLIDLPTGTMLTIGGSDGAVLAIVGLRNPCVQLDAFKPGLMQACLERRDNGSLRRLAGVMAVVLCGGTIRLGDSVAVAAPAPPHRELAAV